MRKLLCVKIALGDTKAIQNPHRLGLRTTARLANVYFFSNNIINTVNSGIFQNRNLDNRRVKICNNSKPFYLLSFKLPDPIYCLINR